MSGGIVDLTSFLMGGVTGESTSTDPYVALSYPLSIPSVSGVRAISWAREEVRAISESPFTLHRQIHVHQGERWRVSIELPLMSRAAADEWASLLLLLDGGYGTFLFGILFNPNPRGQAWGSPVIDGNSQTGRVLLTRGWNTNITGVLLPGDKVQIGSYLYMVTRPTNSDGEGKATVDIWPRLRNSPADGDEIITNAPRGVFCLATPGGALMSRGLSGAYEMPSFEIVEAF